LKIENPKLKNLKNKKILFAKKNLQVIEGICTKAVTGQDNVLVEYQE
jgi:hypothetical protein